MQNYFLKITYKKMLSFLNEKSHILISVIVIFFLTILPFFNPSEVTFRIHDNLDSLGHLVMLSKSGQFFNLNPNFIVKEILNGTPRFFFKII